MPKKRKRQTVQNLGGDEGGGFAEEGGKGGVPRGWQLSRRVREDHGQPLFGLSINHYDPRHRNLFATTGANRVSIYELESDGGVTVRQVYSDANDAENFFTCAWSIECGTGDCVLAAAGQLGVVRVINCLHHSVTRTLVGHGNSINDLRFHPYKPALLLSASKDESIRLWDVEACVCVALFTGDQGHRGEVLSIDFHLDGERFVSAGMDNAVKVWTLKQCAGAISKAETFDPWASSEPQRKDRAGGKGQTHAKGRAQEMGHSQETPKKPPVPSSTSSFPGRVAIDRRRVPESGMQAVGKFRSAIVQIPVFSTTRIHRNYVDCVRWCGDLLLTKSTHNKVAMWKPSPSKASGQDAALVLGEFKHTSSDIWFLRFSLDVNHSFMALGNKVGHIFLWDLSKIGSGKETAKLHHSQCTATIRQTAVTWDSRTILAVSDDASVWRWDAVR